MNKDQSDILDAEIINPSNNESTHEDAYQQGDPNLNSPEKIITTIVYGLQAAALLIPFTMIAGVIMNYVKIDDVKGTWLESHFRWQMRTFWFALLWFVVGVLTVVVLIGYFILVANAVWVIYRMIKGWIFLSEGKAIYNA